MAFIILLVLLVVLIVAFYLAPIVERFITNYIKGLSSEREKGDEKNEL